MVYKVFAPLKIREVENYSTYQIRLPMKIMRKVKYIKEFSSENDDAEDDILALYFKAFCANSLNKPEAGFKTLYPHRSYDPNIKLGQFAFCSNHLYLT